MHVEGDKVVEGRADTDANGQLKVRRAPVYLGGAPPGAKHLPHPKLYRTGETFLQKIVVHSKTCRVQRLHPPSGGGKQEGELRGNSQLLLKNSGGRRPKWACGIRLRN